VNTNGSSKNPSWALVVTAAVIALLPLLFVSFPPATDLPQHLGQVYLLTEVLGGNAGELTIDWYGPNNLIYALIAANALVLPPQFSGRVTMMILVLLWVGAAFHLARDRGRAAESAVLAVPLVYNACFYWGLLNFLIGWPFFVLWVSQSLKQVNKRRWVFLLLLSVLLYASHALWFLMGCVWLLVRSLYPWRWKRAVYRLSTLVPVGLVAILWYSSLSSAREVAGFDTAPHWFVMPFARLAPDYLANTMFGGVRGALEPAAALVVLAWIALSFFSNRRRIKDATDLPLLAAAFLLTVIVLLGPDKFMNTILFSERWFPCAVILLILALPRPTVNMRLTRVAVLCALLLFSAQTARSWRFFQQRELSGLSESLEALPENQLVLGLDYVKTSRYIKGRPFLQIYAYAQAYKGGDLNFSFAQHSSGIVRYRSPRKYDWTPSLDFMPEMAKRGDFRYFDYVLVNGGGQLHLQLSDMPDLEPASQVGKWHLYRVIR
jgi:hypothetical protein